jgi:hypothetical protein
MIGIMLSLVCGVALAGALAAAGLLKQRAAIGKVILGGYALRLVLQLFVRHVQFFSHAAGGDSAIYEDQARFLALLWSHTGVHFVTANEQPFLGATSLPANLFGFVIYLNGGETSLLGCTSVVALAAGLTALNLYLLCLEFKAEPKNALLFTAIIYFEPAFLFYTADMYKDGLVLCLVLGSLGSALRLGGKRWSVLHAVIGMVCVWGLWYVRFYLVFATVAPLVVGSVGLGSKSISRTVVAAIFVASVAIGTAAFTDVLQMASDRVSDTFEHGTSAAVRAGNQTGGSAVDFDDGGVPYAALPAKLAYTLFAPFPWQGGSPGFQIGKLDAFLWYFTVYRAIRGARQAVRQGDGRVVVMLLTFIVPCTVMYAMSIANVGLIMRQRLVIVAATAIFAAIYTPKHAPSLVRVESTRVSRARSRRKALA